VYRILGLHLGLGHDLFDTLPLRFEDLLCQLKFGLLCVFFLSVFGRDVSLDLRPEVELAVLLALLLGFWFGRDRGLHLCVCFGMG